MALKKQPKQEDRKDIMVNQAAQSMERLTAIIKALKAGDRNQLNKAL